MSVTNISRPAGIDEIATEMDRRGAVIERLESEIADLTMDRDSKAERLEAAEATISKMRRLLVRAHDRIHCLPRTSDTELAHAIETALSQKGEG